MIDQQTIAVTGATGFIGRNLVRMLHDLGYKVKVLMRSDSPLAELQGENIQPVRGSLADRDSLHELVNGCNAIMHCAGSVRGATLEQFSLANVEGTARLVSAAAEQTSPIRILALSSLAAREPGLSDYARSKWLGEQAIADNAGNMPWIALRPPAVYGPGDKEMMPLFQAMAKGIAPQLTPRDARFSMIHVYDLVAAMLAWLNQAPAPTGIFELHDGHPGGYNFGEVLEAVSSITGKRIRVVNIPRMILRIPARINQIAGQLFPGYAPMLTPGKLHELSHNNWVCANEPIQAVLDWEPRFPLVRGLQETPGWQR